MGRPALKVKMMNVRLPLGIPERIDALVGERRRATFIRDAVVAEVERLERERGIEPPDAAAERP